MCFDTRRVWVSSSPRVGKLLMLAAHIHTPGPRLLRVACLDTQRARSAPQPVVRPNSSFYFLCVTPLRPFSAPLRLPASLPTPPCPSPLPLGPFLAPPRPSPPHTSGPHRSPWRRPCRPSSSRQHRPSMHHTAPPVTCVVSLPNPILLLLGEWPGAPRRAELLGACWWHFASHPRNHESKPRKSKLQENRSCDLYKCACFAHK